MRENVAQVLLRVVLWQVAHVNGLDLLVDKGAVARARVLSSYYDPYWPSKDVSAVAHTCVVYKAVQETDAGCPRCTPEGQLTVQGMCTRVAAVTDGMLTFSVPISSRLGSAHMIWTW